MTTLLSAADEVWLSLQESDWLEAFAHHPRIGESRSAVAAGERARSWSSNEQGGLQAADGEVRRQIAEANAAYDARFGYICIISAAGKSAGELLAITRSRLANAADVELRIAAEEQRKITRLRLEKLFHDETGVSRT
jgi:OHCU decarboxylase